MDALVGRRLLLHDGHLSILVQRRVQQSDRRGTIYICLGHHHVTHFLKRASSPCKAETTCPTINLMLLNRDSDEILIGFLQVYLIEQSVGFGFGSLLFHIGGALLLVKQSRDRYLRPSTPEF